jgi:hypothetical protein
LPLPKKAKKQQFLMEGKLTSPSREEEERELQEMEIEKLYFAGAPACCHVNR